MSIQLGSFLFEGPYPNTAPLQNESGIYAILCDAGNNHYGVIDIGESDEVKNRVDYHDRRQCWSDCCDSALAVAVLYIPGAQQTDRLPIEQELREVYAPPCGLR